MKLKNLLFLYISCMLATACGSEEDDKNTSTGTTYTFTSDIVPILERSCAFNNECHGDNGSQVRYTSNKATFDASDTVTRINLATSDTLYMPYLGKRTLDSTDKTILEAYLAQETKN